MKTTVTSSGSGIATIPDASQPMIVVADCLFLFDLTADTLAYLESYLAANGSSIANINIMQLQRYRADADFKTNLENLIKYGIYTNQQLCDHCFVITTIANHTTVANAVWPEQAKAITKFNGRTWPQAKFVSEFIPIEGAGSIGPLAGTYDDPEIVTWNFELGYKEEMTSETYTYNPSSGTLPVALDDGVTLPSLPTGSGTVTSYSIIYYWWNEYTTLPFEESHAKSVGNLSTEHSIAQNTITVHVQKQHHVEIIANSSESGGGA